MKIRIAIAEDNFRVAEGLMERLEINENLKVCHIASNGKEMLQYLQGHNAPQLILMDINMPVMDGIQATSILKQRYPQVKVIMSTIFDDDKNIFEAIMAGADGYLLKDAPPEKLHQSIEEVLAGGAPMSPEIARKSLKLIRGESSVEREKKDYGLSDRETEILQHLSQGNSYKNIAANLFISEGTVRKHLQNIYGKLQVHNKVEAINLANKNDLI